MRCESPVAALLESATAGLESAWREIVTRYSPLVHTVCHRYGVRGTDAEDVGGNVWLRLVTNLATIREPKALPKWLMTTARRECLALLREKDRQVPKEAIDQAVPARAEAFLLGAERGETVREVVAALPTRDRELLELLFSDPPLSYATISSRLGMPVGAIGPTRARCLARVRRIPSIAALLDDRHVRTHHRSGTARTSAPRR
jgi:RNA polymerase sigma factor (sigma-70 family)